MKNIIATLAVAALAAFPSHALTKDVDTVPYTALKDIPTADKAVEAVLADTDEFVGDAERRINELNKAALHHRGNAMLYSAASRRARLAGDSQAATDLADVARLFITLSEAERECSKWLSSLLTAVTDYEMARRIGPMWDAGAAAEIRASRGWVVYDTAVVVEREEEVSKYTNLVEGLRKDTLDLFFRYIDLMKQDREQAKDKS